MAAGKDETKKAAERPKSRLTLGFEKFLAFSAPRHRNNLFDMCAAGVQHKKSGAVVD